VADLTPLYVMTD